ncbi:MAG: DMT family transporter [Coriobacteriales bacterium]|jgi:drug/metabolite transporter (DMT)-like permease|nr:DMT family transporter [Coriobacteriales bacterium]
MINNRSLKYSLIMFLAGGCYGFVVPMVRTAQSAGFVTGEIMVTQYILSAATLGVVCLLFSRRKVGLKDSLKLLGVGVTAACVSFCYYQSLALLSPATSLTLLFQFVWMGMVVQAVRTRTWPRPVAVFTALFVVFGAVLATGLFDEGVSAEGLDPLGVIFGLLSAAFYTGFIVLTSRVATSLPAVNRSLFSALGSLIVSFAIMPTYFARPLIALDPLLSMALGMVGICLPIFLIAVSSPKLPTSLATVMASSELPSGVICAAIFLGEPVSFSVGLGVVIILAGIVVSELESLRHNARKSKNGAS